MSLLSYLNVKVNFISLTMFKSVKYWSVKLTLKLIALILTITFLVFGLLLFILVILPIYLYRKILSLIVVRLNPNVIKIVQARGAIFLPADPSNLQRSTFVNAISIGQGFIPREVVLRSITDTVLSLKNSQGDLQYPELRQAIKKFGGFYFWAVDENFDLDDHVKIHSTTKDFITEDDFMEIEKDFMSEGINYARSPWDLLIIHNYIGNVSGVKPGEKCTIAMWRVAHFFADGVSLGKFFTVLASTTADNFSKPKFEKLSLRKKVFKGLDFVLFGLYDSFYSMLDSIDFNQIHTPFKKYSKVPVKAMMKIPLINLKETGKAQNASLTSIIIAGISGGLRKYYEETYKTPVPTNMHAGMPFPFSGHPSKLRNYYSIGLLRLPFGLAGSLERLKQIDENLKRLKNSASNLMVFLNIPVIGSMFPRMIDTMMKLDRSFTFGITMLPGPNNHVDVFETKSLDTYMDISLTCPGVHALIFLTLTYGGNFYIMANGDESVFQNRAEMIKLLKYVEDEYKTLHALTAV